METLLIGAFGAATSPEVMKNLIYFFAAAILFRNENKKMRESLEKGISVLSQAVNDHGTRLEKIEDHVFSKEEK